MANVPGAMKSKPEPCGDQNVSCPKNESICHTEFRDENDDGLIVGNIDESLEKDPMRQSKAIDDDSEQPGENEESAAEHISIIAHKIEHWLDLTDQTEDKPIIASKAIVEDGLPIKNGILAENHSTSRDPLIADDKLTAKDAPTSSHQLVALDSELSNDEELRPEDAIDSKMLLGAAISSCFEGEKKLLPIAIAEQVSSEVEGPMKKQDEDEKALHGQNDRKSGPEKQGTSDSAVAAELDQEEPRWYDFFPGMLSVHDPANLIRQTVWQNQDIPSSTGLVSFLRKAPPPNHLSMVLKIEGSLGVGNHGSVLRAVLITRKCFEDNTDTEAIPVAVKVSTHNLEDRQHLEKEM